MNIIRTMQIDDYEAVHALWLSCEGMGLNNVDDSKEGIKRFLERNPKTCYVAEQDSNIVGAIIAGNDGRRGFIYHTAVASAYRKNGIATKLVDAVLNALIEIGITKVALVAFGKNQIGNAFWEKLGFTFRDDLLYRNKSLAEIVRIDT